MRSFELNKLVRDGVYKNMLAIGQRVTHRVLEGAELRTALKSKIVEESAEIDPLNDDPTELLDVLEPLEALGEAKGWNFEQLRELQLRRRAERGGFAGRIFVERLDLQNDDPWAEYYAGEPERFTEVTPPEAPQTP